MWKPGSRRKGLPFTYVATPNTKYIVMGVKAHKRLPELRADGVVCSGPTRTCRVSGRQAMTWHYCTCKATSNNGELLCH